MADILADLRRVEATMGDTYSSSEVIGMVCRAGDEIQRLRAALERLRAALDRAADALEFYDNKAEAQRARAALTAGKCGEK
jgi:hypothetical protein